MIPILYAGNEQDFLNNGLGRLSDAISCKVTEERNGVFELEMTYPITGIHFADIAENRIIYAKTEDGGNNQAFIIYKISKPLNGIVTINAEHISYLLNGFIVFPFTATSLSDAMSQIVVKTMPASIPFTFETNIVSDVRFDLDTPRSVRALLGGQSGSLLDVYGGYDYKFDNFSVKLLAHRGIDRGVTIRYGKNLTSLKNVNDMTNVYTGIVPYWADSEGNVVYLTEKVVYSDYANIYPYKIIKTVDFSSDFESQPTEDQLRQKAQSYITKNKGWQIKNNIDVSFVALAQSEEYKNIAMLENVKLCDTVTIIYDKLGVNTSARVIKTVYNVLLEKYDSLTLGDTVYTLSTAIEGEIDAPTMTEVRSFTQSAVEHATKLIQGGLGGYVVFTTNADGYPIEILIMDEPVKENATNVIRMNVNGIGFSHTGYEGPFLTAWTIDGHFVADFITTGNLNANLIKVGTIKDTQNKNYWNMATGEFRLSTSAQIGTNPIASTADVDDAIDDYDTDLNQTKVFNKLTNNGALQGIYMSEGQLYINGTYIKTGTLDANLIKAGIIKDTQNKNYWNMATGEFRLSTSAQVGNSPVASTADVSDAIDDYDTDLNQTAVFNKLTNNGALQGIYMSQGQLYINGTYVKTGTLDANLIKAGIIKDTQEKNYWNMATGDFKLSTDTYVGSDSTNKVASSTSVSSAIGNYDTSLNQNAVFNKLTNNGATMGIYLNAQDNKLYINATYISAGTITGADGKFAFNMETGAFTMKDGTLSGVTIQSDEESTSGVSNARLVLDDTTSIKGYYGATMHNLINLEQVVSGTHQMTIDADTQLNIRTPHVYVTNQSAGTGSATVYETITDTTQTITQNTTYYMIKDLGKVEATDPDRPEALKELWVQHVDEEDATPADVYCTLPVYLKYTKTPLKYIHGMLIGEGTTQSVIV